MFIRRDFDQGMAVLAGEAMTSGMLVVGKTGSDGKLHAFKLGSGSLNGRVGLIYVDHEKAVNLRPIAQVDSSILTGNPAEAIALNQSCTMLYGRGRGMTNQLVDGVYNPGDKLTVDTGTSRLKQAGSSDVVVAQVSLEFEGGKVTSQDKLVPVSLQIGGVGVGQTL